VALTGVSVAGDGSAQAKELATTDSMKTNRNRFMEFLALNRSPLSRTPFYNYFPRKAPVVK